MDNYFRCDSCGKLFPEKMLKEVKFCYNTKNSHAKKELSTETMYGMICPECSKDEPVKTTTTKKSYSKRG